MRIQIREKDGIHLTLLFPTAVVTGLLGSRLAEKLILKALGPKSPAPAAAVPEEEKMEAPAPKALPGAGLPARREESGEAFWKNAAALAQGALSPQTVRRIQKELKRCIRQNRRLTLVEVESADGDYVKIVL